MRFTLRRRERVETHSLSASGSRASVKVRSTSSDELATSAASSERLDIQSCGKLARSCSYAQGRKATRRLMLLLLSSKSSAGTHSSNAQIFAALRALARATFRSSSSSSLCCAPHRRQAAPAHQIQLESFQRQRCLAVAPTTNSSSSSSEKLVDRVLISRSLASNALIALRARASHIRRSRLCSTSAATAATALLVDEAISTIALADSCKAIMSLFSTRARACLQRLKVRTCAM